MRKPLFTFCFLLLLTAAKSQDIHPLRALGAGGSDEDTAAAIAVDRQGNVYLGGTFKSATFSIGNVSLSNAGTGTTDAFLAKLDYLGNVIWAKRFGNTGTENITAVTADTSGFLYAVGAGFPLAKLDNNGNVIWQQTTGAARYSTLAVDSKGNVYTGSYAGFRKYRPDGTFVYAKTVPYYIESGDFSLDWSDHPHLFFHANGGTIVNGTQSFNVNLATRVVYDTSGQIISVNQLTSNPRWYPQGYRAIQVNDYYASASYPTLTPIWYMAFGRNIAGSFGYGDGYYKRPVNPVIDGLGNEFYTGTVSACSTCIGSITFNISPGNQINTITGSDIFYIQRNTVKDSGNTTFNAGRTNEFALRTAIDSVRKLVYIAGQWSKMADTAKFRFGSSVLTNAGNGTTNDALLLTLSYSDAPLTANAGFDQTVCAGGSVQLSSKVGGGAGGYTYSWMPTAGLSNPSSPNPVARPAASTNYVLTVTDAAGASVSDTVGITVNPALYKPTITAAGSNPFCEGQQINLFASDAVSYQWSNGSAFNTGVTVSKSDTITVTAVNGQGCIGTSDPFYAVMKPRPAAPVITPAGNLQNTVQACSGGSVTLTAQSSQSPVTYAWNNGATTPSVTTQTNGVFYVAVTGANGCVSLNAFKGVVFYNLPAGSITAAGRTNLCSGDSVQLKITTADTTSVLWNTGATAKSIWVKTAGTYSAQLTTAQGCSAAAANPVAVQVYPLPQPSITQSGNTLTALPAAASYQWYLNNTAVSGATSQTLSITAGGAYSVRVTTVNGCSATASFGAVLRTVNPALTYQVYPNPAKDRIGIVYTLAQAEKTSVTITDPQGKNLLKVVDYRQQAAGDYQYSVSTAALPKGLVYVVFTIGNKIISHKVIVL